MRVAVTCAVWRGLGGHDGRAWKRMFLAGLSRLYFTEEPFEAREFVSIEQAYEMARRWKVIASNGWRMAEHPELSMWQIMPKPPHVLLIERTDRFAPGGAPYWPDPSPAQ